MIKAEFISIKAEFISQNRKANSPPNPGYPRGMDIDLTKGEIRSCQKSLPYPAECVGVWLISCSDCGLSAAVTAGGRADDPRSIRLPCKAHAKPDEFIST